MRDDLPGSAAQVSYYILFSLFPLLFFLVTLTAFIPPLRQSIQSVVDRAAEIIPTQPMDIIRDQVRALTERPKPRLLTLGLVVAIYSASLGVDAFRKALNRAHEVVERRSFWRCQLIALILALLGAFFVLLSFGLMLLGGELGRWAFGEIGVGSQFVAVWSWLRFPIIAVLVLFLFAFTYFILPDVDSRFRPFTPGTAVAAVGWIAATWGFAYYSDHFGQFNVMYGSLGGAVLLLVWFYISAFVYLLGAEIDVLSRVSPRGPPGAPPSARGTDRAGN